MSHRRVCLVPFCAHYTGRFWDAGEWICGQHWRHVSQTKKRRLRTAYRRWAAATPSSKVQFRWSVIWNRVWGAAKREAIEAGAGIA